MSIYPNPFNHQITIQYTITQDGPVKMYLLDALGRTLAAQDFGQVTSGIQRATFGINNLLPGTYVLVLDINGQKEQRVVIKK